MAIKKYPESNLPIRSTSELLPSIFQTEQNEKFLNGTLDALTQPGVLKKIAGYVGRRYGKTYNGNDVYVGNDETLRSRYQLEPGVTVEKNQEVQEFYDYLDFKNILKFFGNDNEIDSITTDSKHYSWNPPIDWDKFINYRQYYWVPEGPLSINITGQSQDIISTYKVRTTDPQSWLITPDGSTPNPTLELYRGQTYNFDINAPGNSFVIRTNYDTGSLLFDSNKAYDVGQLVLRSNVLYRALVTIPILQGVFNPEQWEAVDAQEQVTALDYNEGVINNNIESGRLTFTVPLDAPDILYYQSSTEPDRLGQFIIKDIEENSSIDIENEVIGKKTYISGNDIEFSNGMVVTFSGQVTPETYASGKYLVEGVGTRIRLINFDDLVVPPTVASSNLDIIFDNEGFDTEPFDNAATYPGEKDYITINKSSIDRNPWSRYNRWFHKDILEFAHAQNNSSFSADESVRAKRPIIEFLPDLQLVNHGGIAKDTIDLIDTFTTDVFSTIEGSSGYNVDNVALFEGARILFTADTDSLVQNKIYEVQFIDHNGNNIIHLEETTDSLPAESECVIVRYGNNNAGKMYHYTSDAWIESQTKNSVNQSPLFELFDESENAFSDTAIYDTSTFEGTPVISYKAGTGSNDTELGFPISYLNINNVGDIEFTYELDTGSFDYIDNQILETKNYSTGYLRFNNEKSYDNCWTVSNNEYHSPIVDSVIISDATTQIVLNTVDFSQITDDQIYLYVNDEKETNYQRNKNIFTFETTLQEKDVVSIKIFADVEPVDGYFEIPKGLEQNPLNENIENFTVGTAVDHVATALEFSNDLETNTDNTVNKIIGSNKLRDLSDYIPYATRFMKHDGINALALYLLCDKENNIIKSLEYAKSQYRIFKNDFIKNITEDDIFDNPSESVDSIMKRMTDNKTNQSAFKHTDMIGFGAYTSIDLVVDDVGIKTFSLSSNFDLNVTSNKAVYVYVNDVQLYHGYDYEFNSDFGFVTLNVDLTEGDTIEIREYLSTVSSFIPATPTKLGLYKKYKPEIFVDDTFVESKKMIQGHDGSLYAAFDDYRDDIILELEKRIYNNIKISYNETLLDIDSLISGYYDNGEFSKELFDSVISKQFLKWISNSTLDYTQNNFLDTENSFTYTYSNMIDPSKTVNLPGYWRGVYRWFFNTDRPHTRPWEMLGFSEMPNWWESEYGPAPYTRGNLVLWEDLENGIIKQGSRAGTYDKYKRPGLTNYIPVDDNGNLLSPLTSGLAKNFVLVNNQGPFVFGDVSPVESAWRYSSDYPYSIIIGLSLLQPFKIISQNLDKVGFTTNLLDQTVDVDTLKFKNVDQIEVPTATNTTGGLLNYLTDYVLSQGKTTSDLQDVFDNFNVRLSHRLSGFVDQEKLNFVLDSKNPRSASESVFMPSENYQLYFNESAPIETLEYSGVIIEKVVTGFKVNGYNQNSPYFKYYKPVESKGDPVFEVGGISESFVDWAPTKFYANGVIARFNNRYYRAKQSHTSGADFDTTLWTSLPKLPTDGGVEAFRRKSFTNKIITIPYGTVYSDIQSVVDFLLGYQKYLESKGFVFDSYDTELKVNRDWFTSAKEFMFWSTHQWAAGSLIALSPLSLQVNIRYPVGVSENIFDSFYDFNIFKSDGTPLKADEIDAKRSFQNLEVKSKLSNDGIYFLAINYVLKEHVALFDDRTVFNDVIYDKNSGYRQQRIKVRGFKTADWDGDYTSPGFIFDNVNIQDWQPFTDYKLGDIVSYREFYYTSLQNQTGSSEFNETNWTKLDLVPQKELIPNYDYKINQFEDYFNLDSDAVVGSQRELAQHTFGYQEREYLSNLIQDEVTQFKIYQGYIREKGSLNSISKVFDKLSRIDGNAIDVKEEWAFKTNTFGGVNTLTEKEFRVPYERFQLSPQPLIIQESDNIDQSNDQYVRITPSMFTISDSPFTKDIFPTKLFNGNSRNAGYVSTLDVDYIVKDINELLLLDIAEIQENQNIWLTFENASWNVYRFNRSEVLFVEQAEVIENNVEITFNRAHNFSVGDIVGFKQIPGINGFHVITFTGLKTIRFEITPPLEINFDSSTVIRIYQLTSARFSGYDRIPSESISVLDTGSTIWIDNNEDSKWEVIQKEQVYQSQDLVNYGVSLPVKTGYNVLYLENLKQSIVSIPGSTLVSVLVETSTGLSAKQILQPPTGFNFIDQSFGYGLGVSPDEKYLAIGAPLVSDVPSQYQGKYNPSSVYNANDIVEHDGKLWRALVGITGADGSTINIYSGDWTEAVNIPVNTDGDASGLTSQGVVLIYERVNNRWNFHSSFVSPRPNNDERFGENISISKNGSDYQLAVGSPGALRNRGRIYLFDLISNEWKVKQNVNYRGLYNSDRDTFYPAGSIVYYNNNLWRTSEDVYSDGSTITIENEEWQLVDPVSTHCSLPTNISLPFDGSTIDDSTSKIGILSPDQIAELTKEGDQFGKSFSLTTTGNVLVVGAPFSDEKFFENYRGSWQPFVEYIEGDVVRYQGSYHVLTDPSGNDSAITSTNERPDDGLPWQNVGDSSRLFIGKVFIYVKNENGFYDLKQTISSENFDNGPFYIYGTNNNLKGYYYPLYTNQDLANSVGSTSQELSFDEYPGIKFYMPDTDINLYKTQAPLNIRNYDEKEEVDLGDQFGYKVDIDGSGSTIVVSSPLSDIDLQDQGAVYIFKTENLANPHYRLLQKLTSYENFVSEFFGSDVSISKNNEKIVVGAKNSPLVKPTTFDLSSSTTFDSGTTNFIQDFGYPGQVYVFERKPERYFLAEKLQSDTLQDDESFGSSVDCSNDKVLVGSPDFVVGNDTYGTARIFSNSGLRSISTIAIQNEQTNPFEIQNISLFDNFKNTKTGDVEIVDSYKFKFLSLVEQELSFKTMNDPAIYTVGTDTTTVQENQAWFEKNVGKLWFDLSTVKWLNYEQEDIGYKISNWNRTAYGSSVDVYEWVETKLLPSEWSILADTTEGLSIGISGQPLYPNDTVYSQKILYNIETGEPSETLYYYWVKDKKITPDNAFRSLSAFDVKTYIETPISAQVPFVALIDKDTFIFYNYENILRNDQTYINFLIKDSDIINPIHKEYQLLTEGDIEKEINEDLELKWIDSLIGYDLNASKVPDPDLPDRQKYGISFRPRQSMFVDKREALKIVVNRINLILSSQPYVETLDLTDFFDKEDAPVSSLNLYDTTVETYADLINVGAIRLSTASLRANIVNGEIDTVDILDPGFGYRVAPTVEIVGTGENAQITTEINSIGQVTSVTVINPGRKYTEAELRVRAFSILVESDETSNNFWSIYEYDENRQVFFRSLTQEYDVSRYWNYIDWWDDGYGPDSKVSFEIDNFSLIPALTLSTGNLIRIKEYGTGGWVVLEKNESNTGDIGTDFDIVGREDGTISLKSNLYDDDNFGLGFDSVDSFDTTIYDKEPYIETRKLLYAIKNNIFVNDLATEWNNLFFASIKYVFTEQEYVDWVFKTSFINVKHTVGDLDQPINYRADSLESYLSYLEEVKPFRSSIREFVSSYNEVEDTPTITTDFDLPPYYNTNQGKVVSVNTYDSNLQNYPWKYWSDNQGFSIVSIEVANGGSGYTDAPRVVISGNGSGATARAFIRNGSVNRIQVLTPGSNYVSNTTVSLVGGNGSNPDNAIAVPILGDSLVRTFDTKIKFDRISKNPLYSSFVKSDEFTATGNSSVFVLNFAPTRDKNDFEVYKNNQILLNSEYSISLFTEYNGQYTQLKGKLTLSDVPDAGDTITVSYNLNNEILDSVARINKFYNPTSGMKGKQLNQLMTGVDFGGVQIQGNTFDVTGGWDALPWFTDNWDSIETNTDYYVVSDGSTTSVTLPYTPESGEVITIYLKRADSGLVPTIDDLQYSDVPAETKTVRIDDLYFDLYDGTTVQPNGRTTPPDNALMPSFVGDGSTKIVEISDYVKTYENDILVFRKLESDGTVVINDDNIVDTNISGGNLDFAGGAYSTANGTTAEEIVIEGGKFISPENSAGIEENIPGQVLESLSFKVFTKKTDGAAPLLSKVYIADGIQSVYSIGQTIIENSSIKVYLNKNEQILSTDFEIDYVNNTIEFVTAPTNKDKIEIFSIGLGGVGIIDYQEFQGDGETSQFLTKASFDSTSEIYITVDGIPVSGTFEESSELTNTSGKTLVRLTVIPEFRSSIKILCLESLVGQTEGIVRVNEQQFVYDGSTTSYALDNFVTFDGYNATSSVLVTKNGLELKSVDTIVETYDGTNLEIELGIDPEEQIGSITSGNIKVFVNDEEKDFVIDYVFDGNQNLITLNESAVEIGDRIKIETNVRAEYEIVTSYDSASDGILQLTEDLSVTSGDVIEVTWFEQYPSMDIITDQYSGGQLKYKLSRQPVSIDFVKVFLNGVRLTQDQDYYIDSNELNIYLKDLTTSETDSIKIIQFGTLFYSNPSIYEIHKDMLNQYQFTRLSVSSDLQLARDLNYYDTEILVTDASLLFEPRPELNQPGVLLIGKERIEYFVKTGNTLSQLRRGTRGTSIGEIYNQGVDVVDVGPSEQLPYNETITKLDFVSDGSTTLIGPLEFVPSKTDITGWFRNSIPENFGQCNDAEVFVAGMRLRKQPVSQYDETKGDLGNADAVTTVEAEFSCDGVTPYIRLTEAPEAGTRIFIIKKQGYTWYNKGEATASAGISLLQNNTDIAKFLRQKSSELPE